MEEVHHPLQWSLLNFHGTPILSVCQQGRSHPHISQGLCDLCFQLPQFQLENLDLPETWGAGTEEGLGVEAKGRGCEVEEL